MLATLARGERVGGIPFGSQLGADGRTLEPHHDEQRALSLLRELRAAGCTVRAVADELNR
jgi:site-specific DNA recombinase